MVEISVLITNYSYGRFLGRCLRSLLNQSLAREKYEIVVVDDASNDNSRTIYEVFQDDIKLFYNNVNLGLPKSLNVGLRHCKGRFIVRVDADDYVHSDFLKILYVGFELSSGNYEAVSCDYFKVDEFGNNYKHLQFKKHPIACGVMFKSEVFEQLGLYNTNLEVGEDIDLMTRFKNAGYKTLNINLPLYRYVQHGPSLSSKLFK